MKEEQCLSLSLPISKGKDLLAAEPSERITLNWRLACGLLKNNSWDLVIIASLCTVLCQSNCPQGTMFISEEGIRGSRAGTKDGQYHVELGPVN